MSIQGVAFTAIADAIRSKDGSTEPIRALDFAERIKALGTSTGDNGVDYRISLLEEYNDRLTTYTGILHMPDFTSAVECPIDFEVLEGDI